MASTREDEEVLVPQTSRSVQTNQDRQSPVNKEHLLSLLEPYQVELCFCLRNRVDATALKFLCLSDTDAGNLHGIS